MADEAEVSAEVSPETTPQEAPAVESGDQNPTTEQSNAPEQITAESMAAEWRNLQAKKEQGEQPVQDQPIQEPAQPASIELPAEIAGKFKVKTLDELVNRYAQSSQEGHRLAGKVQQLEDLLHTVTAKLGQPVQGQAPQQDQQQGFFGFASKDAYNESLAKDPQATFLKMMAHGMKDPEIQKSLGIDSLQQLKSEAEQSKRTSQRNSYISAFESKYKPTDMERQIAAKFVSDESNHPMLLALEDAGMNMPEIAFKMATYDTLVSQLKGMQAKSGTMQKQAVTARPGTSGRPRIDESTVRGKVEAAAAEQGKPIDPRHIEAMERSIKNHFGT